MIGRLFFDLLLFLLPFALYAIFLRLEKRDAEAPQRAYPWAALFVSGLALVAASFIYWGITEGSGQQGVYVPPHVENGRVVPGRIEPEAAK